MRESSLVVNATVLYAVFLVAFGQAKADDTKRKELHEWLAKCETQAQKLLDEQKRKPSVSSFDPWRVDLTGIGQKVIRLAPAIYDTEAHRALSDLYPEYVAEMIEVSKTCKWDERTASARFLDQALFRITRAILSGREHKNSLGSSMEEWQKWWENRETVPARFVAAYKVWNQARAADKGVLEVSRNVLEKTSGEFRQTSEQTSFGKSCDELRTLGLDAVPLIIEQFEAGDYNLKYLFEELTDRKDAAPSDDTLKEKCAKHVRWWRDPSENAPAMRYQMPPLDAGKKKK